MRSLSEEHINAYKSGILKRLFDVIRKDPELSFEIRMKDEAIVYYHKDKILSIKMDSRKRIAIHILFDNIIKINVSHPRISRI